MKPNKEAPSLLILENDPEIRDLLNQTFSDEGYRVRTAVDGKTGLQIVQREPITTALVDLNAHDKRAFSMNGQEFAIEAKKIKGDIEIAIMTASPQHKVEAEFPNLNMVARDVVYKPFDLDDIVARIGLVSGIAAAPIQPLVEAKQPLVVRNPLIVPAY